MYIWEACTCFWDSGVYDDFPKTFRRVSSPHFGFPCFVGSTCIFILYLNVFCIGRCPYICMWPSAQYCTCTCLWQIFILGSLYSCTCTMLAMLLATSLLYAYIQLTLLQVLYPVSRLRPASELSILSLRASLLYGSLDIITFICMLVW